MSPIFGAIEQSFSPTLNGEYAVIITKNTCVDTSDCVEIIGVNTNYFEQQSIKVFPNPTDKFLNISLGKPYQQVSVNIKSSTGILISNNIYQNTENIDLDINAPSGLYFLEINSNRRKIGLLRILIEHRF